MNDWTESLKVGDIVGRRSSNAMGRSVTLHTVVKLLATQIVIKTNGSDERFNRKSLQLVGSDAWSRTYLIEADARTRNEAKEHRIKATFRAEVVGNASSLTLAEMEAMLNALEACRENEKERP